MSLEQHQDISKYVVAQSNDLIEAHYSSELTTNAHKVARLVLSLINPDDKDVRCYTIPIKALKQYLGVSSNAFYQRLKETAQRLNKSPIEIKQPNGKLTLAYFISGYEIDPAKGTVKFEISSLLKPFLLDLKKNYTSYLLLHIPKLKSGYSIRLYELLHQYRKIGRRRFELSDLQKKVGSKYEFYGDFKRKVIKQAQKDLKKHTDINFVFDEIKTGRKVTALQFVIFGNKPTEQDTNQLSFLDDVQLETPNEQPAFSNEIIALLNEIGINEQSISKYFAKGFEIIKDKDNRIKATQRCQSLNAYYLEKIQLAKVSKPQSNPTGFLIKALQENWVNNNSIKEKNKKDAAANTRKAHQKIKQLKRQLANLEKEHKKAFTCVINPLLSNKDTLEKAFSAIQLEDSTKTYKILKPSLTAIENYNDSPVCRSHFHIYFEDKYPNLFVKVNQLYADMKKTKNEVERLENIYS